MRYTTLTQKQSKNPKTATVPLSALSRAALEEWFRNHGWPAYRARQVWHWFHCRCAQSYDDMTDLPLDLRTSLAAALPLRSTSVLHCHISRDRSEKRLIRLADGEVIETVWIPMDRHATVCVSTQAGCPIGCVFCASGASGFARNLDVAEIVEQVWHAHAAHTRSGINNLVFMGMGEPLLNIANLAAAINILADPAGMRIGARRMTISTVGVVPGIQYITEHMPQVNLAVSLHATTDTVRKKLIKHCPSSLAELMPALTEYYARTHRRITFEYVLVQGENDTQEDAEALAMLARRLRAHVNLIPYNRVAGVPFEAPDAKRVHHFSGLLTARGIVCIVRRRKGDDIAAACGQLRRSGITTMR